MNLLSKLHKNSILTGPVESYCLACSCLLRSEEESYSHIYNPDHEEKLQTLMQLEQYKNDCILKSLKARGLTIKSYCDSIQTTMPDPALRMTTLQQWHNALNRKTSKEGYYCPYCSIILPTIKRVSLHVTDPKHTDNKNSQSITRHAGVIFAFDAVVIDPRSWHGLDGSTCSVCDQDYADEELHKQEATHILNLIQAKCQFGENFIYRKVDEDLFFCLICNDILPVLEKPIHHESERHLQLYEKSINEGIAVRNQTLAAIEPNNNKVATVKDKEAIKLDQVAKDSKETKKTREKTPENKTQNGSSNIVDDNRTTPQTNIPCSINLNTENVQKTAKLNTEREQKQESKSDSQSKPQEATKKETQENKLDSQNNSTREAEVNSEKNSQVLRLNLPTKTQDTAQLNTSNVSQEVKLDKNTQELIDKTKSLNTNSAAKATEAKKSEIVTSKVGTEKSESKTSNGTSKVETDKSEPYLYEFLKARNFIIKAHDGAAFCTLCDVGINEAEVGIHSLEKHHSILYTKHAARKNSKLSEKTLKGQDRSKNKESESSWKSKVDTVIGKATKAQKDKPAEVTKEVLAKDSKTTDKTVVEKANNTQIKAHDSKLNKENTAPDKNAQRGISMDKTNEETQNGKPEQMDTTQPKRAIKKAKKRAAKAKSAQTEKQAVNDNGIPTEVSGPGTDVTTEEINSHKEASSATLIDESKQDDKVQVNGLHIKNDTEQVTDADSKEVAQVNELITDLKTEKLLELIKSVSQVDSTPDDVVINSKYVLGNLSFVLIVRTGSKAECVACDEELPSDRIQKHIAMDSHRSNVEECLVVTSLDDEFIRQVKNQKCHCGYCNMVLPNWQDMEMHLQTFRHSDAKTCASWRLERYLPHLRHCQTREVRSVLSTIFRCTTE